MSQPSEPDLPAADHLIEKSENALVCLPDSDITQNENLPIGLTTCSDGATPNAPLLCPPDLGSQATIKNEAALPSVKEEHPPEVYSTPSSAPQEAIPEHPPFQIVDVDDLNWQSIASAANPAVIRSNIRATVERMEALLDQADGPGMLFDRDRADPADKVIQILKFDPEDPLWIIGDLHGDLLALEAALAAMREPHTLHNGSLPRVVFLGDLFDDAGFGLEVLLRVFELIVEAPDRVCVIAGNHDEALVYDGVRFASSVTPSDFADFLNANLNHEWIERAGKLAVRLSSRSPRALFFPDGLLAVHGGFPLADLHPRLMETGDWNDPVCLSDFVWTRAHPKARKKLPNRFSRGSQFGYEDFAAFCAVSAKMGRPVARMVRGHDHVEERYASYPAYRTHPVLTIVALSRRLSRESFGPYERVPAIAQYVEGALPCVYRLHIPAEMIRKFYPNNVLESSDTETTQDLHI
jgi:hypothetical protein